MRARVEAGDVDVMVGRFCIIWRCCLKPARVSEIHKKREKEIKKKKKRNDERLVKAAKRQKSRRVEKDKSERILLFMLTHILHVKTLTTRLT